MINKSLKSTLLFLKFSILLCFKNIVGADEITYSVSALPSEYGGTSVGVVVDNGTPIPLEPHYNGFLWRGKASKPSNNYYYVILDSVNSIKLSESQFQGNVTLMTEDLSFTRTLPVDNKATMTLNDIFGTKYTVGDTLIKGIPRVYPKLAAYDNFSLLYQEAQVPNIRVVCPEAEYTRLTTGSDREDSFKNCTMTFITPYEEKYYPDVLLSLAGMGSLGFTKRPFKIEITDRPNETEQYELYDRSKFKLRNLVYDCTYIKNKLAVDLETSLGMPGSQSGFARLYVNNQPFGLYDLFDPLKKKFIKENFHPGEKDPKLGVLYKCMTDGGVRYFLERVPEKYANLYTVDIVPSDVNELEFDGTADISELINFIYDKMDSASIEEIEKFIDVDLLFKCFTVEYLIEHRDGFLIGGNNYNIYRNYQTKKFYIWSYDFDATFGKFHEHQATETFEQYMVIPKSYFEPPTDPNRINQYFQYNPLAEKLFARSEFKERFMKILGDTAAKVYNKNNLGQRALYFKEFLKHHMYWDSSVNPVTVKLNTEPETKYSLAQISTGYESIDWNCSGDEMGLVNYIEARSNAALAYTQRSEENIDTASLSSDQIVGGIIETQGDSDSSNTGSLVSNGINSISYTLFTTIFSTVLILYINYRK